MSCQSFLCEILLETLCVIKINPEGWRLSKRERDRERDREIEREKERDRDRQRDRKTETERDGERESEFEFEFIYILQRLQIRQDASFHLAFNTYNIIIT